MSGAVDESDNLRALRGSQLGTALVLMQSALCYIGDTKSRTRKSSSAVLLREIFQREFLPLGSPVRRKAQYRFGNMPLQLSERPVRAAMRLVVLVENDLRVNLPHLVHFRIGYGGIAIHHETLIHVSRFESDVHYFLRKGPCCHDKEYVVRAPVGMARTLHG